MFINPTYHSIPCCCPAGGFSLMWYPPAQSLSYLSSTNGWPIWFRSGARAINTECMIPSLGLDCWPAGCSSGVWGCIRAAGLVARCSIARLMMRWSFHLSAEAGASMSCCPKKLQQCSVVSVQAVLKPHKMNRANSLSTSVTIRNITKQNTYTCLPDAAIGSSSCLLATFIPKKIRSATTETVVWTIRNRTALRSYMPTTMIYSPCRQASTVRNDRRRPDITSISSSRQSRVNWQYWRSLGESWGLVSSWIMLCTGAQSFRLNFLNSVLKMFSIALRSALNELRSFYWVWYFCSIYWWLSFASSILFLSSLQYSSASVTSNASLSTSFCMKLTPFLSSSLSILSFSITWALTTMRASTEMDTSPLLVVQDSSQNSSSSAGETVSPVLLLYNLESSQNRASLVIMEFLGQPSLSNAWQTIYSVMGESRGVLIIAGRRFNQYLKQNEGVGKY